MKKIPTNEDLYIYLNESWIQDKPSLKLVSSIDEIINYILQSNIKYYELIEDEFVDIDLTRYRILSEIQNHFSLRKITIDSTINYVKYIKSMIILDIIQQSSFNRR